ncbi:hypothetical protein [Holospora curviuscula]|nr:hypothetical protein [Holospora curviuscula]
MPIRQIEQSAVSILKALRRFEVRYKKPKGGSKKICIVPKA